MNNHKFEEMAMELYTLCKDYCIWLDVTIYFNNKAWSSYKTWGKDEGVQIGENLYEYKDKNPLKYFEYANPETLSMSFEGALYEILNWYRPYKYFIDQFDSIFEKYGYYYEFGNEWNLSAYKN